MFHQPDLDKWPNEMTAKITLNKNEVVALHRHFRQFEKLVNAGLEQKGGEFTALIKVLRAFGGLVGGKSE